MKKKVFTELSKYSMMLVASERKRYRWFERGLRSQISVQCDYAKLVNDESCVEKSFGGLKKAKFQVIARKKKKKKRRKVVEGILNSLNLRLARDRIGAKIKSKSAIMVARDIREFVCEETLFVSNATRWGITRVNVKAKLR